MSTHPAHLALAAVLGLGGLATGVLVAPAMATAATTQTATEEAVGDRVSKIEQALAGLVSDGTLTQEQADRVATTLDEQMPKGHRGHGGRGGPGGPGLETAAETLGLTVEELRTELREGQALADVAEAQGVSTDDLVAALVEEAKTRLAEAVADGRLTQEQADERAADLPARIAEKVEREGPGRGGRGGPPPADAPEQPEGGAEDGTPAEPSSLTG